MGFINELKSEIKRELRNVMKDMENELHKTWELDYCGHHIKIIHQIKEEILMIDGKTIDTNKRKYIFSHIIPYSKLSGMLELQDGTKQKVSVKFGGYIKFNCIVKISKETILKESRKIELLPWKHREKIVPFIQQQIQTHNKLVDDRLPDEPYLYDESEPRLAAGLADLLIDPILDPSYAKKLIKLFGQQLRNPTSKTRKATYEKIIFANIASYKNEFSEQFQLDQFDEALVQQEAIWLLEHAVHRGVVKFAILVLGCTNCEKYKELLFTLGLHEEFTLYVLSALRNGTIEANNQIWRIAQFLHGWGKILAVEQLEARTPEIKQWFLKYGCDNSIMNEYSAYTCAIKGELDVALYEDTISKELYEGAGRIIVALINHSEPQGIEDYPYTSVVLSRFVNHASMHCETIEDFYPIMKISEYLQADQEIWEERLRVSWKQYEYDSILQAIQQLITNSKWSQLVHDALQKEFDYRMLEIASFYQIDVTHHLFHLLEQNPRESELYLAIILTNNRQYIEDLCKFAEAYLTLSSLSIEEQVCLQCIVQDLGEYEGIGLTLLQTALASDDVSLQYHSLNVLGNWSPSYAQQLTTKEILKNLALTTKDKEIRQLAKQLLKG